LIGRGIVRQRQRGAVDGHQDQAIEVWRRARLHDGGMRQTGLTLSPVIGCLWGDGGLHSPHTRNSANMLPFLSRAILTVSLIISSAGALAETNIGLGNQRCGAWVENNPSTSGGVGLLYQQWVFGFLSGVSYADSDHDPLKGTDAGAVTKWFDDHCREDTAARLVDVAIAFIRAHRP
jgi:hypothetical protein